MEFKDLIYDMLVEEVRNKKLLNTLFQKWKSQNQDLTPEEAEWLYIEFMGGTHNDGVTIDGIQNRLSLKSKPVANFLTKFNGEFNREKFDPENIKDIRVYSYAQITDLLKRYGNKYDAASEEEKKEYYFFEDRTVSKNDWVEKSKELWFGDRFKIYDDGNGFRIYHPKSQKESILFGFWQKELSKQHERSNKWCVTNLVKNKGGEDSMQNLWGNYRDPDRHGRTFYFIIDETKSPDHPHYIGALQKLLTPQHGNPFILTNAGNQGDIPMKINDPLNPTKSLQHIYPQLTDEVLSNETVHVDYNAAHEMDLEMTELERLFEEVEEVPGPRDFVIQDPDFKRAYIQAGNELEEIRSLESLDDDDLKLYLEIQLTANVMNTFKNHDMFIYLLNQRSGNIKSYIIQKLEQLNTSVRDVYAEFMKERFVRVFSGKQNENIEIVREGTTGKYGIINSMKGSWLQYDNVVYKPEYDMIKSDFGGFDFDLNGEVDNNQVDNTQDGEEPQNLQEQLGGSVYIVEAFSKVNNMDDRENFYVVNDPAEGTTDVHILSHKKWVELREFFVSMKDSRYSRSKEYSSIDDKID